MRPKFYVDRVEMSSYLLSRTRVHVRNLHPGANLHPLTSRSYANKLSSVKLAVILLQQKMVKLAVNLLQQKMVKLAVNLLQQKAVKLAVNLLQ